MTLEGLLEQTQCPSRAFDLHARRGGPRTPSRATDANLDCAFVENALVAVFSSTRTYGPSGLVLVPAPRGNTP